MFYRRNVVLAFGAAVAGTAVAAATPLIERQIIDNVVVTQRHPLAPYVVALVAAGVIRFGLGFVRRFVGGRLALDVQYDLRNEVFGSLERLDGARQDQIQTGQVVSRAISDVTVVQGLLSYLPFMAGNILLFVASLVVMAWLSPLLTVVALALGPGLFLIALRARRTVFPATWAAQQQAGELAGVVEEAVAGVRVVKGFGQEAQELGRLEAEARRLFELRTRSIGYNSRFTPMLQAVPAFGQVGVLALGGWLALRGEISLGTFLAFSTYLGELVGPTRMLAGLLTVGQQAKASVIRIFEVLDSRPAVVDAPDAVRLGRAVGLVELDDVGFGYVRSDPVLDGLSLRIEPGQTLALVGASGSGKSTVSLLLPRFYDVQRGAVRLDGHDVRELTLESLRAQIGVVFEDSFLFSDTIRANIAYGRPDATEEQVRAAARAAEADGFARALPDGYDTVIGEQGLTLSGGQRQRVALARALLTDPPVLLLDDATSAVDARIEAEIHATLRAVTRGRTTLIIAHRRSTLRLADRIAVIDAGRVVDVGTEAELHERCPLFRLLLAGPGDDAEGTDAGLLDAPLVPGQPRSDHLGLDHLDDHQVDGVTPRLWRRDVASPSRSDRSGSLAAGGRAGGPAGMGRISSGTGGAFADVPATPDLLDRVDALPPAVDDPKVDNEAAAAPDPSFSLGSLLGWVRWALAAGLVLVALDALAGLALPALVRHGIDAGVNRDAAGVLFGTVAVAAAVVVADWVVQVWQTLVTGRMGERLLYVLRVKTFAQLQRLGLDYYERELSGRIMTRMTTDVDALSTFLQTGLTTAVVSVLSFFGVLVAMLLLDVRLALTVLTVIPVLVGVTVVFRRRSSQAYTESRERVSAVNASLQENLTGVRVAQAFRRESVNEARFADLADRYRQSRLRAQKLIALYFPFVEFLSEVAAAIVLGVGAGMVVDGTLSTGALIAFLLYLNLFFSPVQQLSQVFDGYQQAVVGLRRLSDLLRTPTSTPQPVAPRPVGRFDGEIVLAGARFAYAGASTEAVAGADLRIAPGETVALVGETGAGKSTVVKLVARFYDVTGGSVTVDGIDVRELDLPSFRHRLGIVGQEPFLFSGTVRDAIAYARPEATDAEVEAAARAVGAHEVVARLPGGYLHPVGERGRGLSAGQRQLLALARAELADPDILLLDEATAALDLATEAAVTAATQTVAKRRTTIVVAHRLTTAARADRVIVMDAGRIVEQGTHAELVTAGGPYSLLWDAFADGVAPLS